jgi:small subunit ribosomal protein S4
LVNHGHITVNNKVINIPSFQCRINDVIGVKSKTTSQNLIKSNLKLVNSISRPPNLEWNDSKLQGSIKNYCLRSELLLDLNELLVIEYYSRR